MYLFQRKLVGPTWSNDTNNLTDPVLQFFCRVSVRGGDQQIHADTHRRPRLQLKFYVEPTADAEEIEDFDDIVNRALEHLRLLLSHA
jgi:hypothetical protein